MLGLRSIIGISSGSSAAATLRVFEFSAAADSMYVVSLRVVSVDDTFYISGASEGAMLEFGDPTSVTDMSDLMLSSSFFAASIGIFCCDSRYAG